MTQEMELQNAIIKVDKATEKLAMAMVYDDFDVLSYRIAVCRVELNTAVREYLSVLTGNEYREEAARKIDDAYTKEAQKKANTWAWVFGKKEERKDGEK
ncbi:hypothetical protein [Megasphaera massiliensis]|jgi:hypothetical protein|uniref:hypothetical protein n=1 Tax=Megasphaera massiliensis TaxID=1232428 RepID=UPI002062CE29|nr:hypothetical protein [uncultured Megasphaera sp.]DAH87847.1 MAG TPA: hypothetical protein [Bacteriophage sp.]